MNAHARVIDAIGNTPLIRLRRASEATGCEIFGKAEFMNPGGSVKDRAALYIVRDAEARGALCPGGVIVEGTAGNTGIGLAMVGNARGYRTVIVIPETQSAEKKDVLRQYGADVREVPAVPSASPNHYVKVSARLAEALARTQPSGAIWANQFDNLANRRAHYETTGPEIWRDTDGKVDGYVCAVGTGGTLAGVALYLKERNPGVVIGLADPMGAALYHWYAHGVLKAEGSSITEGIGQSRITANLQGAPVDVAWQIADAEALELLFALLREEGLALGTSSGINVAGAMRLARHLGPGHTIVTILADGAHRYASRLYNPHFLRSRGLPVPEWLEAAHPSAVPTPLIDAAGGLTGSPGRRAAAAEVAHAPSALACGTRIQVHDEAACRYWCKRYGMRPRQLKRIVRLVGTGRADVEDYLSEARLREYFEEDNSEANPT